jgi:hypothetical protein
MSLFSLVNPTILLVDHRAHGTGWTELAGAQAQAKAVAACVKLPIGCWNVRLLAEATLQTSSELA